MASIEGAIRSYVLSVSTVATLCSSRMYYLVAPQESAMPYIVYQDVSDPAGPGTFGRSAMRRPRFQFDVYGTSSSDVVDIRDAIVSSLRNYAGTVGTMTVDNIGIANIQTTLVEGSLFYRAIVDAIIDYQEA